MIQRAYLHVTGPAGAGKTTFVEAVLQKSFDRWILAARCQQDDTLRESRESVSQTDPELTRYREAGAGGAARFVFPPEAASADDFFMTDLMEDPSDAVILEGDNPLGFVDLSVFVAPPPPEGAGLFVRRQRDRAKEERARADDLERLLQEPDGMAQLMGHIVGDPLAEIVRGNPDFAEEARAELLARIARSRKRPPPAPTEHWGYRRAVRGHRTRRPRGRQRARRRGTPARRGPGGRRRAAP